MKIILKMNVGFDDTSKLPIYKNSREYRKCVAAAFKFCITHVRNGKDKMDHESC